MGAKKFHMKTTLLNISMAVLWFGGAITTVEATPYAAQKESTISENDLNLKEDKLYDYPAIDYPEIPYEEEQEKSPDSKSLPENDTALVYFNSTDFQEGIHGKNVTKHAGFLHGFVEALSVILVSELGDKTFFIAAIMAMTNNKLTIFLGAITALGVMTVLSALLGFVVTSFIPKKYTYYTCTAIMFLFGLKMLYEAWKMKPEDQTEEWQEVQDELARRGSIASNRSNTREAESGDPENPDASGSADAESVPMAETNVDEASTEVRGSPKKKEKKNVRIEEKSLFGKKCYKIFQTFVNCFTMTFLAEWGDRSQLATIVLASINDVTGICVGGVLGHCICTGIAVICGALVAKKISVRVVTLIGALVFLGFAVASLFIDPETEEMIKIDF